MQLIETLGALAVFTTVSIAQTSTSFVLSLDLNRQLENNPDLNLNDFDTSAVSFGPVNNSLYIGQFSFQSDSEPFYASFGDGSISFTSYHSSPTGITAFYVFPSSTEPVGLTIPHTGEQVPGGATDSGFGFNSDGYLTFDGENNFIGCDNPVPNSFQIYWLGTPGGIGNIPSQCIGPLFLTRVNVTLSFPPVSS